jgi:hypothetical protein
LGWAPAFVLETWKGVHVHICWVNKLGGRCSLAGEVDDGGPRRGAREGYKRSQTFSKLVISHVAGLPCA